MAIDRKGPAARRNPRRYPVADVQSPFLLVNAGADPRRYQSGVKSFAMRQRSVLAANTLSYEVKHDFYSVDCFWVVFVSFCCSSGQSIG
jgi:hypothetical protein